VKRGIIPMYTSGKILAREFEIRRISQYKKEENKK
jgi:hypothetical protein